MAKVLLKVKPDRCGNGALTSMQWKKALPFYLNPRGLLIHRVESVTTYFLHGKRSHIAVTYLCNNSTTADGEFLAKPPAGRLVCHSCELFAKKKRKPSADQLVGRHVHVGRIRVEQACCCEQKERN